MESIHQKLAAAQQNDSRWVARIVVHIPTPPCVLALMNTQKATLPSKSISNDDLTTTNIFPIISHPPVVMVTSLEEQLNCPPGISF